MNPLYEKAPRQVGSTSRPPKKSRKKKRAPKGQSAGQPSAPGASVASERSGRSTRQVDSLSHALVAERSAGSSRVRGGDDSEGSKAPLYVMGTLHAVDAGLGVSCLVYGGLVHVVEVTAVAIFYGLVLVVGCLAGVIGYCAKSCDRIGLQVSAVAGLITALLYIAAFILVIDSWDSFVSFLDDNSAKLMLSDASASTVSGLQLLFAVIFIVLACFEAYRFFAMRGLRKKMLEDASSHIPPLGRSISKHKPRSGNWFTSLFGLNKRKKSEDFVMFDDNASMESALLWSKNGGQPASEDYLEFVPEHERSLENFTANVSLPMPPPDKTDY